MNNDVWKSVFRSAKKTWIIHTIWVVVVVVVKNFFHWEVYFSPLSRLHQLFRIVEAPVAWLVDASVRSYPLPRSWDLFGRFWVAASLAEILLYGIYGGIFYSLMAAFVTFVRARKRARASASMAETS